MRPGSPETLQHPYDPARIESRWAHDWEARGVFRPRPGGKPFVISIPPPNVTGSLTMGHLLGESIRDLVLRWQRMEGREVLYLPGMDHAGIATQNVVERELEQQGTPRETLGREQLVRRGWAGRRGGWTREAGATRTWWARPRCYR